MNVILKPLEENDREQFILDNQEAFRYGALEEFGCRDSHFEEDGEIISKPPLSDLLMKGRLSGSLLMVKKSAEW